MAALCRDCLTELEDSKAERCPECRSPRLLSHPELNNLSFAHIDCDAFYAAVEKRDNPELQDKPLIIGGGQRGVVSTACYIARTYGIHSAMPMFKARELCPQAVILKPSMDKYSEVGREVRAMMRDVTPLVEPISIDEAFLNLTGTERLHGHSPAHTLAQLQLKIEDAIGITVSVGLAPNKFLAKMASDQDKPRGFFIIGEAEKLDFLARQPVSKIWGVGKSLNAKLKRDGITKVAQLQKMDQKGLINRYGSMGDRLYHLSRGLDSRRVSTGHEAKSISGETTFMVDVAAYEDLEPILWRQCERVSARAKKAGLAGKTVTLKLKTKRFRSRTRSRSLADPTQLADVLFQVGKDLMRPECDGTEFRLLGIGLSHLVDAEFADPPDLIDQAGSRRADAERAVDSLRDKFGSDAVQKGRALRPRPGRKT